MNKIGELFSKKIDRRIEEVIKVSAPEGADLSEYEKSVQEEIEEYVATDAIKDHFCTVYKAIADAPADPHEGIGIWVSGFFGSGKSSFAKILGYTLAARRLSGTSSSEIFKQVVKDSRISAFLDSINTRIPTDAVVFDVSMERGVRTASERITEIMYKALLRELDYADDFDLAELEFSLEVDGLLEKFRTRFQELHKQPWEKRRKLGRAVNEASAVLNDLDSKTYPSADSWAKSLGQGRADITPNQFAERAFELMSRRRPNRALVFVVDEVGQYVSRSVQKMLDLQAVVQAFGATGKNRVKAKKAIAPCWIIVTSQEKLNEVVDSLEGKKVELARLQERFPITIDLKQSDISEVTGKRVLEKSADARKLLGDLYTKNEGRLKTCCVLERTTRDVSLKKNEFVNLYPYVPYQIDLCIDIVAGLRLKRGAQRHIGGSNRTIIKQAQQMLVHPRTNLAGEAIGALVTLDRVYELLYLGNLLPSEVTREVDEIPKHLPGNEMAHRVAKAIALLEAVKDLPRTPHNIAVVLHPTVEADFAIEEVKTALKALERAQIVRESEEGYKLLTVEEKHWDIERSGLEPKPVDRNRIKRELLGEIFADPKVKNYRHKNIRPFKVALSVDGEAVDVDGQIPLNASLAEDPTDFADRCKDARAASNERKNEIFWVVTLTEEIHRLVEELHRSREMVSRYEREQAAGKLSPDRSACLAEEKIRRDRVQRDLRLKLGEVLHAGAGFFRGVQKDGSALGHTLPEVVQGLLEYAVPHLYPKLEMGARPLKGDEPEKFLTAANLTGLPPIFYDGENGLNLVLKQGGKLVPNPAAEICKEVLDHIRREHSYGNKVTGKSLEAHFQGIGYGWERDILRLVLAVLLRGGAIEVTHQGRKYRNHNDPACREPFTNNNAFKSASYAPREALDLKMLTDATRHYEEITGKEVEIEEGAIAQAFQKLAAEDRESLLPLISRMRALGLPGVQGMEEFLEVVEGVLDMPTDDCVKTLAGEGKSYREARSRMVRLVKATEAPSLAVLARGRQVLQACWPAIEERGGDGELAAKARDLRAALESPEFYEALDAIQRAAAAIEAEHRRLYDSAHAERTRVFEAAVQELAGSPEWAAAFPDPKTKVEEQQAILSPLKRRACTQLALQDGAAVCATCRASLNEIEADTASAPNRKTAALQAVASLLAPTERVERVRVASFLSGTLSDPKDVEEAIERLKERLLKLLAEGVRVVLE